MKTEKNKYLKEVNDRIYEQLSFAEAKNGVLVGMLGAVIIALLDLALSEKTNKVISTIIYIYDSVFLLALLISLFSFFPCTNTLDNKENLFFWGDIAKFQNAKEYLAAFEQNRELLEQHLAIQNIQVSRIIQRKNNLFSLALKLIAIAFCPILLIYFLAK